MPEAVIWSRLKLKEDPKLSEKKTDLSGKFTASLEAKTERAHAEN